MEIYHINPWNKTISRVNVVGTLQHIARIYAMKDVQSQEFNNLSDRIYFSNPAQMPEEEASFHFYCGSCNMLHEVKGHAFITGPELAEAPMINMPISAIMISWQGQNSRILQEVMQNRESEEAMFEKALAGILGKHSIN